jgi:general secretion pathway protein I
MMTKFHGKNAGGFTLLEVLIALAILASVMTVLMGTMANSGQQAIYANQLTRVSQFARIKMVDLEYEMMEEGFSDDIEHYEGDFREEGYPEITWEADVHPVEIPEDVKDELIGQVNAQLFGGQNAQGALKGNAAFSSKLPMLVSMVPMMINHIGAKTRRVKLKIHYQFAGNPQTLTVTQYVVDQDTAAFDLFGTGEPESGNLDSGGK